jgi:hypothetical protein
MFWDPNTSTSLQTILAADVCLAGGQYLLEEQQTLNKEKYGIPSRNSEAKNFQNRRAEFETKIKLE